MIRKSVQRLSDKIVLNQKDQSAMISSRFRQGLSQREITLGWRMPPLPRAISVLVRNSQEMRFAVIEKSPGDGAGALSFRSSFRRRAAEHPFSASFPGPYFLDLGSAALGRILSCAKDPDSPVFDPLIVAFVRLKLRRTFFAPIFSDFRGRRRGGWPVYPPQPGGLVAGIRLLISLSFSRPQPPIRRMSKDFAG